MDLPFWKKRKTKVPCRGNGNESVKKKKKKKESFTDAGGVGEERVRLAGSFGGVTQMGGGPNSEAQQKSTSFPILSKRQEEKESGKGKGDGVRGDTRNQKTKEKEPHL